MSTPNATCEQIAELLHSGLSNAAIARQLRCDGHRAVCVHGHDQSAHGKYERDGRAYCDACKSTRKRAVPA